MELHQPRLARTEVPVVNADESARHVKDRYIPENSPHACGGILIAYAVGANFQAVASAASTTNRTGC
jgi:hypothetical protein